MAATDRRETESGIEVKPVYTPGRRAAASSSRRARRRSRAGIYPDMYRGRPWTIRQYAGLRLGRGVERALPLPARARARPGSRSRSTCRPSSGSTPTTRAPRARSGAPASRSTRSPTWRSLLDGIPLDEVSTSMTINAPAALLLLLYELVAEEQGVAPRRAARHGAERHPQGVHRARELHLPAASVDAAHDRPVRVLRRAAPALEHDLDLRLPHPRGRLDGGAGARVHGRERDRLLRGGGRGGPLAGRVRRAAVVLLQRAQRLLPGGGEVPGGAAAVGARDGRALRRDEPEGARAALPRADRRLDAHRAAAREQHRARRDPGAVGRAAAARSRCTRTRSTRRSRCRRERAATIALRTQQVLAARGGRRRRPPTRSAARTTSRRSPTSSRRARGS